MSRRKSRDVAVKLIYQQEFDNEIVDLDRVIDLYIDNAHYLDDENEQIDINYTKEIDRTYLKEILLGVNEDKDRLDELISKHAKGWSLERMSKIDIAILRLATFELFYRPDIPKKVSINEAIELAKKYSYDEASSFINGILAGIVSELGEDKNG